jgi:hypothetical protein
MGQHDENGGGQGGRWARVRKALVETAATLGMLLALGASHLLMPEAMKQQTLVPDAVVAVAREWGTRAARTVWTEVQELVQEHGPAAGRPTPLRYRLEVHGPVHVVARVRVLPSAPSPIKARVRVHLPAPLPARARFQLG